MKSRKNQGRRTTKKNKKEDHNEKLHELTEQKQELESTLFTSYIELQRLRLIVQEQEQLLSWNKAVFAVEKDELKSINAGLKKALQDEKNRCKVSKLTQNVKETVLKKKTQCQVPAPVKLEIRNFKCAKCSYVAKRKYTLKIHQQFHCPGIVSIEKDAKCRICGKSYTHNGLRSHLLGIAKAKNTGRKPRGRHAEITAQKHFDYLNKLNLKNKM